MSRFDHRRVFVYGVTGSGKSTTAARLSGLTGIDWYSVDDLAWQPGWVMMAADEQRRMFADICARDRWILDTAYGTWLDLPLARADLIVALDLPRWVSFAQLLQRTLVRMVTGRPVCNGNRETWRGVVRKDSVLVWHFQSFTRKGRRIRAWEQDSPGPAVLRFTSRRRLDAWLRTLRPT